MNSKHENDALAEAIQEDAEVAASHTALLGGGGSTDLPSLPDGAAKAKPVSLAEMQFKGSTIIVGQKPYKVSPLVFGDLSELQRLANTLPDVLFAAVLSSSDDENASPSAVDPAEFLETMRAITKNDNYSPSTARRDFSRLAFFMRDAERAIVADIILLGISANHPDVTAADFLPHLSIPSSIAAIRAVSGGAVADFLTA